MRNWRLFGHSKVRQILIHKAEQGKKKKDFLSMVILVYFKFNYPIKESEVDQLYTGSKCSIHVDKVKYMYGI